MRLSTIRRQSKVARSEPETIGQAHTWDRTNNRYKANGFCPRCASQAAWGHQLGFTHVHAICPDCVGRTVPPGKGDRAAKWAQGRQPAAVAS